MRRVYRKDCACPATWAGSVQKALPDYREFRRYAAAFERLGINSSRRRAGFSAYAPHIQFTAIWGKRKEIIAAMSHRKCVYCEGAINAPRAAHVEHFKPKSLFPALAYEWTNYFLGCPGCNGAKSDKWPERGGYIRPDQGDPSRHFLFSEDGSMKALKPRRPAERMVADFGLNRTWLADERKQNIDTMLRVLNVAVQMWKAGHRQQARRLARTVLENSDTPEAAYSVALTQCFWRAWKAACPGGKV
ncbi:conserved hypothetical protein [Candidatus Sulfopaludibacter sp. SbA4]|nr:conserved hypothetical protein [Candidatus Sulfopaludibacter sp. SbA4]